MHSNTLSTTYIFGIGQVVPGVCNLGKINQIQRKQQLIFLGALDAAVRVIIVQRLSYLKTVGTG